jgi:ATP-dependent 26S proteasome regulatory subunit
MWLIEDRHVDEGVLTRKEFWPRSFPGFGWELALSKTSSAAFELLRQKRELAARAKMKNDADEDGYKGELYLLRWLIAAAYAPVYFACNGDVERFPIISATRAIEMFRAWTLFGLESWTLQQMKDKNMWWERSFTDLFNKFNPLGESRRFIVIYTALLMEEVSGRKFQFNSQRKTDPNRALPPHQPRKSMGSPQDPHDPYGFLRVPEQEAPAPEKEDRNRITFADIGGQAKAKKELMKLAVSLNRPELYARWGGRAPRGVLLNGPPGTGKTLLARALADAVEVEFYNVSSSQVKDMWYSKSARNVDEVFAKARQTGGVIFFDEADGLFGARTDNQHKTHDEDGTVIAALNRNMDGFEPNDRVVVILATNFAKKLDEAATRAGRIDRFIEVPLPDAEGRKEIFKIHMRNTELRAVPWRQLFPDVDAEALIRETEGYNGADIAEVIRRAIEAKVFEEDELLTKMLENKAERENNEGISEMITTEDILREIRNYERKVNKKNNDSGLKSRIGF